MSETEIYRRTMSKVSRRLIPLMILMFCVNFLDRVNISFAALQMNQQLGFTPQVYGFAAGVLFVGYTFFGIPSNMALDRVGARLWISWTLIVWGIIGAANACIWDRTSLYVLRFTLGMVEAGFTPGVLYYMMRWFPAQERGTAFTLFLLGSPISVVFGAPLSTALLSLHGFFGLQGWQWLFVMEGLPAVLLGLAAFKVMTESPAEAEWLSAEERTWLTRRIATENAGKKKAAAMTLGQVLTHPTLLAMAAAKFCVLLAFFGVTLWLPQIVRSMGHMTTLEIGFVSALPYASSAVMSVVISRSSDRTGERTLHIALPSVAGCVGFAMAAFSANPYVAMLGLCIAATGVWVSNTVFWALPANLLAGSAAATGIAMINMVGNFGGFFGPYLTGWVRSVTSDFSWSLVLLGGFLAVNAVIVLIVGRGDAARTRAARA